MAISIKDSHLHIYALVIHNEVKLIDKKHSYINNPPQFPEISMKHDYSQVLYMSFDRFLLAVESHDLSQAEKSNMYFNF